LIERGLAGDPAGRIGKEVGVSRAAVFAHLQGIL
jgi:hypothetical protein